MSCFDDPSYMAQAKDEIRQYVETGMVPKAWRQIVPARAERYFADWELRAVVAALRKAGPRCDYSRYLPRNFKRSSNSISQKIAFEGGREAFLQKYGDLA